MNQLGVKRLTATAKLPTRSYEKALAYDLYADSVEQIRRGESLLKIHTGIAIRFPTGFGGLIRDRSGLASEGSFVVAGVIDEDYTGEIMIIMHKNKWKENPQPGDKVAQLILLPTPTCDIIELDELPMTQRGDSGFGSTGK